MPRELNTVSDLKDSLVVCQTSSGTEIRATLVNLTRFIVVFEMYGPTSTLRMSEVLGEFRIIVQERTLYAGRAVVRNLINTGAAVVCEATLEDSWLASDFFSADGLEGKLQEDFARFIATSQKTFKVLPEFKVAVTDLQMLLLDLRMWLEQIELGVRSQPSGSREEFERRVLEGLREPVLPTLGLLFERFEAVAAGIETELQPAHSIYAKRLLHPVVLCSPFMYRTFQKPLGYAGDYEMVSMMVRNTFEGGSVFAKMLNTFFLNTPPVVGHRNRIDYLYRLLIQETSRVTQRGQTARIFNLACGPAAEVQRFLREEHLCERAQFTLLDFNEETLRYVRQTLEDIKSKYSRGTPLHFIKKSVHHLLKESAGSVARMPESQFDFIYCAGLFDYLSDPVCRRLVSLFYDMLAPGGLVLVSNVDVGNPSRGWMEYVVDWNLIYRNSQQMAGLIPKQAPPDAARVVAESTGVNIFLEIRKPENA